MGVDSDQKTVSGEIVYKPEPDFPHTSTSVSDSFSFIATDGVSNSVVQIVSVTVEPVADTPVADNLSTVILENSVDNAITLAASDSDGDVLSFSILSQPVNGKLRLEGSIAYYTPDANISTDRFTFKVNDGQLDSSEATVTIAVGLETVVSVDPVVGTQTSLYLADGEVQVEIPSGSDPAISSIEISVAYSDFKAIEIAQTDLEKAEVAKDIVKQLKKGNLQIS